MLCCLLCLIVCAVPALANDVPAVLFADQNYCYVADSSDLNTPLWRPFEHISATLDYSAGALQGPEGHQSLFLFGDVYNISKEQSVSAVYNKGVYFEVIFPCNNGGDLSISTDKIVTSPTFMPPLVSSFSGGQPAPTLTPYPSGICLDLLVDDVVVSSVSQNDGNFDLMTWPSALNYSGKVSNHFSIRFSFQFDTDIYSGSLHSTGEYAGIVQLPYDIFTFEERPLEVDKIDVVIGKIDEINGSVQVIESNVVEINNNLSQINDGLQDSNSSIWGAFKDSVSGLFVPSADDLTGVKNGFDQLAQDKLGGAYQSFNTVIDGVHTVNDKFKNPGASPGVVFPGISVPLGGDVGTVTLAASQIVTLPEKITGVLYPVAGVIIPIVCAIWTIRQCLEMLEYFMSGMSYAEYHNRYLHEEDD